MKAVRALDDVTKSQDKMSESAKLAAKASQEQRQSLQQLVEAHTREKKALEDSSAVYRFRADARKKDAEASRRQLEELKKQAQIEGALAAERQKHDIEAITSLRREVAERQAADVEKNRAYHEETSRLRKEATLREAVAREASAANQRRSAEFRVQIAQSQQAAREATRAAQSANADARIQETAHERVSKSLNTAQTQLKKLVDNSSQTTRSTSRLGSALERVGFGSNEASRNLRGLNAEFRGLLFAAAIKYAQSLVSVLVTLAAQLFAVAAAATQAAVGIGGALSAGAAQAIPVIGVLAATFARLAAVLKVVKLQNQQQLAATHTAAAEARRQASAADAIRSAEERVADAHRNTANAVRDLARARSDAAREEVDAQNEVVRAQQEGSRNIVKAQEDVTQARKDAIRTVQDLIASEEDAFQQLERARTGLQSAVQSGDVAGAVQAEIDVRRARTGLSRARQDAAPVRRGGIEAVADVQQAEERLADTRRQSVEQITAAERRLADVRRTNERQVAAAAQQVADARRQEARASDDLARTRVNTKRDLEQETAAVDKLADSLKQLSPAERDLYRRIIALQEVYRRAARPITDIIIRAFSDVVDRVTTLLRDPRILRGFRNIATEVAASIRAATREAGGEESISAFQTLTDEATRNIPIVTRIITNLFRTARSLVLAAIPAFRLLLSYAEEYSKQARDAAANSNGLSDFFVTGVRYAKAFFDLALSVVRLFLALSGSGGAAAEGIKTVDNLTDRVDALTEKVRANAGKIRAFFASTRDPLNALIDLLGDVAKVMARSFSPASVISFVDFLRKVVVPAVGDVVRIMGALVTVFHTFLSLPGVSEVARLAATFLLLAKGLTVIRVALAELGAILPEFAAAFNLVEVSAAGAITALTPIGWVVAIIAAIVAAVVLLDRKFHFLGVTFNWIKHAAIDAFHWVLQAAKDVVSFFSDVWTQGLLYWIRYPFVAAYKWFTGGTLGKAIIRDVKAVIDFFAGPAWATIKALVVVPFETALAAIKVVWGVIKSIVVVALDVLSGRFERIGPQLSGIWSGIWDGIKGTLRTALNALIDMVNAAIDAINKVSPFHDIGHIGHIADDTADQVGEATDTITGHYDAMAASSEDSANRTEKSMARVSKAIEDAATKSENEFKKLADGGRVHLRDIRQVTEINMQRIAGTLGTKSREGKEALANNFRQAADAVQKQMDAGRVSTREGMRAIRGFLAKELQVYGLSLSSARNILKGGAGGGQYGDTDNNLGREGGASLAMHAGGGIISGYGDWPNDGHVVLDPYGRPTARVSGNEGIVNPPQMERINQWGSIVKGLGLDSAGSLQDLWGMRNGGLVGRRRFAGGGSLQLPATFKSTHQTDGLPGYPAIDMFAKPGTPVRSPISGRVVKLSGRPPSAGAYQGQGGPFGYSIYLSGQGRTYFLTHFGNRMVRLGQRVRRGQDIGFVGDYPDSAADHIHEGLHNGPMAMTSSSGAFAPVRMVPNPKIVGGGDVGRAVGRALRLATAGANNLLTASVQPSSGNFTGHTPALSPDANVVSAFRRAIRATGATRLSRLALWEAGIVESGLRNLNYGDADSLGALQERASIYGRGHALNPFASGVRFLRDARALLPWRGSAGQLAAAVQRPAAQFRGRYDQVRGQAVRYLRGGGLLRSGGPIKGVTGRIGAPPKGRPMAAPAPGGGLSTLIRIALGPALNEVNDLFASVADQLHNVARGPLKRSKDLGTRIARAFDNLTREGGLLDRVHTAVENIATHAALRLQQRRFTVGPGGPRRGDSNPVFEAQDDLQALQATRGGLSREQTSITSGISAAERSLALAQKRNNKKGIAAAKAALENLRARQTQNTADLAQNAQDQVEAVENFQQALLKNVNDAADHENTALERWSRVMRALGHTADPNQLLDAQMGTMRRQISGLQGVLDQALRTGNIDLASTVRDQIDELNVSIAEAVAQKFQNSIDAVNAQAQKDTTRVDRAARRAQIGGTDYAALGDTLVARGNIMNTQRAGLAALLAQAITAGNVDQIENLTDQIDELDTSMAENTQAVKDNTDAAFNATTALITERSGFAQSVFSGVQGFFQALGERTGIDTMPQQLMLLQGIATALGSERGGLLEQIKKLTGIDGTGLSGQDLANWLVSIATGPTFDAIMSSLDPTQQQSFKDLVTALLSNITATESNTKAIDDLTGNNAQSFSSSFWSAFRVAVFNGDGGLMPAYQGLVPTAGASALAATSNMMMAGTTPGGVGGSSYASSRGGDTFITQITSPTEVLDPVWHNRQLAFLRKTSGR